MNPEPGRLDLLVNSVAGGEAVDWGAAEAGAGDALERSSVRALRDLERIAAFHRSLQRSSSSGLEREGGRWGELLLLERVGAGASGEVYRAWDPTLQREVALKLLRP